ncbi:MAG TPA: caspase family protein [Bacillota bacterium]|nr:caspase family protein [Bacillota bacterium]
MPELRKALIVGIDHYRSPNTLHGCVKDAISMQEVLARHGDPNKGANFKANLRTSSENSNITKASLMRDIEDLFNSQVDVALFYFSGHGYMDSRGGALVTQDASRYSEGVTMHDLMTCVNDSKIKDKLIILDCCHSGSIGSDPLVKDASSIIPEGVMILTACDQSELAVNQKGKRSIFTSRLVDALNGEAADILGHVRLGNVYALIDESLGAIGQRPIFKANVQRFISLRDCIPTINLVTLETAMSYFPDADAEYQLDPEHEPTYEQCVKEKTKRFANLQACRAARLVEPTNPETKHMYFAAMQSETCRLTTLGKHYWKGVKLDTLQG